MKKPAFRFLGTVIGIISILAILSGCSQGYTSGSVAQTNTPSSTQTTASGPSSKSNVAYPPQSFKPTISGNNVSISMADVAQAGNGNFPINNMSFMAYQMDGKYYVRANVCVPCGSQSFTLQKGILICNTCGTLFSATTGAGVSGVSNCMTYGKKAAAYTVDGGNIVMTMSDLTAAYQNTVNRKN